MLNLWLDRGRYQHLPAPLVKKTVGLEERYPWREGKCVIFRLPFMRRTVVIGRWTGEQPRENVDGIPLLTFRALDHPEDYFHVDKATPGPDF